ncbi:MAG TPA: C-terminal binding protein [Steroidobacteraceae bacterium]|nr:C-terminal binding protein [Steroidobacteraceae bacterium]
MTVRQTVLLTDYAWPDVAIEAGIIEGAGLHLVTGPAKPASAEAITRLASEHQPVAIMTNWATVSADAIAASSRLRIVTRLGVGLDNIAVDEATRRGIWVTNVPDYCLEEVSDHAVAMLLAWARGLTHFDREVKAGRWEPASARLHRVRDLTCGLIGLGRTGRRTAEKLRGLGMRLLGNARHADAVIDGVEMATLQELLRRSDAVIVHLPLTPATRHLIDRERIALMKAGAFLINVSRGAVLDTAALVDALESGRLSGAALDVLENEPRIPPGLLRSNVILTPHIAFSSTASLRELRRKASEEVVRVLRGEPPEQARNEPAFLGSEPPC